MTDSILHRQPHADPAATARRTERSYRRLLALSRSTLPDDEQTRTLLAGYGRFLVRHGRPAEAARLFREGLARTPAAEAASPLAVSLRADLAACLAPTAASSASGGPRRWWRRWWRRLLAWPGAIAQN